MKDIRRIAEYMDSKYRLPFGWRIGWDGILGFVPGVGDAVTNVISFYIVLRAAHLGCPPSVLLRMGVNLLIDNLIDFIPLLGNFLDIAFKANQKNVLLLESYLAQPHRVRTSSRLVVLGVLMLIVASMVGLIFLAVQLGAWILSQFQGQAWSF